MPLLAISLLSAGAIAGEIVLMRLYSIVQWHHFAFMIISIALLGYGASGTFLAFTRSWLVQRFVIAWRVLALLFGVTACVGFALAQRLRFNPLAITWEPGQLALLAATYLLLFAPFFFAATAIGLALSRFGERIGGVYAADLLGAGLGALGAMLLMTALPAQYWLLAVLGAGFASAAAVAFDRFAPAWLAAGVVFVALAPRVLLEPEPPRYKGLYAALLAPDAAIVAQRDSPLGRITVVESPRVPFRAAEGLSLASPYTPPEQLGVFNDGAGPEPLMRFDGDLSDVAYLDYTTEAAPYHVRPPARVLVLGAGAGQSVLLALYHRAGSVDAAEGDPFLARLLNARFSDYMGRIYERPPVRFHVAEARAFVAAGGERYDLVHVPLSASTSGSIMSGITESYTYTTEALAAYLDRLAPGGLLAITREEENPPRVSLKLVAASADVLAGRQVVAPERHIALVCGWRTVTLLVKKEPFTPDEIARLRAFLDERSFDAGYYPGMRREEANRYNVLDAPYFYDGAIALLGDERRSFMAAYKFNLNPATDDRPHFGSFFKWTSLPEQIALHSGAGYPLAERGYLLLVATLLQALPIALLLIVAPLPFLRRRTAGGRRARTLVYFVALGLAFLFIEIAFIQRFTLFLGHPLYAVAVVLAAFLIFAGLGAAASKTVSLAAAKRTKIAPTALAAAAIAALALLSIATLPGWLGATLALPAPAKALLSVAFIAPLAFMMGLPFPLGLAALSARDPALVPWAWGVNGCASVLSPVLATLLAIHFGFAAVVGLAAALYALAAFAYGTGGEQEPRLPPDASTPPRGDEFAPHRRQAAFTAICSTRLRCRIASPFGAKQGALRSFTEEGPSPLHVRPLAGSLSVTGRQPSPCRRSR